MSTKSSPAARGFLAWLIGNLLGWGIVAALVVFVPWESLPEGPGGLVALVLLALPPGLGQWVSLRRRAPVTGWWLLSVLAGMLVFVLMMTVLPDDWWSFLGDDEAIATLSFGFALLGAAIGLVQGFLLGRGPAHAVLWVLAGAAGMGLGMALVLATDLINQNEFVAYLTIAAIYAILTGLAWELLALLDQPRGNRLASEVSVE